MADSDNITITKHPNRKSYIVTEERKRKTGNPPPKAKPETPPPLRSQTQSPNQLLEAQSSTGYRSHLRGGDYDHFSIRESIRARAEAGEFDKGPWETKPCQRGCGKIVKWEGGTNGNFEERWRVLRKFGQGRGVVCIRCFEGMTEEEREREAELASDEPQ
ncbi:hypothetical protein BJ508DRAFT_313405 [Ascobolus immersus RN42]|uniref:Uncharacterized protein n=1 Tax=Ascobolus immersus RN42 TaxID=1160509 RepID=A0A3N4HIX7_ASCIM|nr:hypothetical protein BJ508DRAFT_313405 [Ascobolus immersus RN42]